MQRLFVFVVMPAVVCGQYPSASPADVEAALLALADMRGYGDTLSERQTGAVSLAGSTAYRGVNGPVPVSGLVSAAALRHRVPRSAKQAFARGASLSGKEVSRRAEYFEKAVALDPGYVAADLNPGVEYFRLGRFQEAESQTRRTHTFPSHIQT